MVHERVTAQPIDSLRINRVRENAFSLTSPEQDGQRPASPAERLKRIHAKETLAALQREQPFTEAVEKLKKSESIGHLLQDAESLAIQTIFGDFRMARSLPTPMRDEILNILETLTNIPGQHPTPLEKISAALTDHNFSGIREDSPEYLALLQANAIKEFASRAMIREVITTGESTVVTPAQKEVLLYGTQIADVVDEVHIAWWQEVQQGKAMGFVKMLQRLAKEGKVNLSTEGIMEMAGLPADTTGNHTQYDYIYQMIRQKPNGALYAVPYNDASTFGSHIERIDELVGAMETAVKQDQEGGIIDTSDLDVQGILETQRAWIAQLKATDPAEQKRLADERDTQWMKQSPAHRDNHMTMQLIYGMESYSAPVPLVQWAYTLAFPDTRPHMLDLNERARLAKDAMVGYFTEQSKDSGDFPQDRYPALTNSIHLMEQSRAQVYALMKGGDSLGFLFAATNLPNTAAVRLEHGAKIFENRRTFTERAEIVQPYLENVLGKGSEAMARFDKVHLDQVIDMLAGVFVPLHEVGHNLAIGPQTRERLTAEVETNVEETKADLAGIVGSGQFLTQSEDRELFITALFMEELRGLTRRAEQADRSHYNGNIINIQLMMDAGVLVEKENGEWDFNFTPERVEAFFNGAKSALQELVSIYENPSPDDGNRFIKERFAESDQMKKLLYKAGIMLED